MMEEGEVAQEEQEVRLEWIPCMISCNRMKTGKLEIELDGYDDHHMSSSESDSIVALETEIKRNLGFASSSSSSLLKSEHHQLLLHQKKDKDDDEEEVAGGIIDQKRKGKIKTSGKRQKKKDELEKRRNKLFRKEAPIDDDDQMKKLLSIRFKRFPLPVFKKTLKINMLPMNVVNQSALLRSKITINPQGGYPFILFEVHSLQLLDGMVVCMHELVSKGDGVDRINEWNFIASLRASCMISTTIPEMVTIREFCISKIREWLKPSEFLEAVNICCQFSLDRVLGILFNWLKGNGSLKFGAPKSNEEGIPPIYDSLYFDPSYGGSLVYGTSRMPVSVFYQLIEEQNNERAPFYRPPTITECELEDDLFLNAIKKIALTEEASSSSSSSTNDNDLREATATSINLKKSTEQQQYQENRPTMPLLNKNKASVLLPRVQGYPGMIKTYVERKRFYDMEGDVSETHFIVHKESTGEIMFAACNYSGDTHFSLSKTYPSKFIRHDDDYLGEISCNIVGTTFTLFDHGASEKDLPSQAFENANRRELGTVTYDSNVFGRIPNVMQVSIPSKDGREPRVMKTRQPNWNEWANAWTLDFKGRVKIASKKNFQLLSPGFTALLKEDATPKTATDWLYMASSSIGLSENAPLRKPSDDDIVLLFGKYSKNRFNLDYRAPICPVLALAIALTTFADKLMVV